MLLFFPFFGLSMTTHVLGMLLFFILFTLFLCLSFKEMGWGLRSICLGASTFLGLTMVSQKMREMFWGHTIYYSLGLFFLVLGVFLYFKFENLCEQESRKKGDVAIPGKLGVKICLTFGLLLLVILFGSTNGISALSIFSLPFVAGIFMVHFADSSKPLNCKENRRLLILLISFVIMILSGVLLSKIWAGGITAGYEAAYSTYSAQSTWTENAQSLFLAWLQLLGVADLDGVYLASTESIINLIHILGAVMIAVFPIIATCFYNKYPDGADGRRIRMWIWLHWAVTLIIMLGYIFGELSAANWRLIPIVGTGIILTILFLRWGVHASRVSFRIPVLLFLPVIALAVCGFSYVAAMPADSYKDNYLYQLADELEERGLTYGYATFWQSNSITVITDSQVKVRCVSVDENGVHKRYYQTQASWYDDQEGQEEYFLLLTQSEFETLESMDYELLFLASQFDIIELSSGTYYLFVFDENIWN